MTRIGPPIADVAARYSIQRAPKGNENSMREGKRGQGDKGKKSPPLLSSLPAAAHGTAGILRASAKVCQAGGRSFLTTRYLHPHRSRGRLRVAQPQRSPRPAPSVVPPTPQATPAS